MTKPALPDLDKLQALSKRLRGVVFVKDDEGWIWPGEVGVGVPLRLLDLAPELERRAMDRGAIAKTLERHSDADEIDRAVARIVALEAEVQSLDHAYPLDTHSY